MPREKSLTSPTKRSPRKKVALTRAEPAFTTFVDPEHRAGLIAKAAYFRAEKRGFAPGHEVADWMQAEAEVDSELLSATPGRPA